MGDRQAVALQIVNQNVAWSGGAGFIPIPILDFAAVTAFQGRMLYQLASHYDVPFRREAVKSVLAALVGGALPTNAAWGMSGSLLKSIPGVGTVLGMITMPAFAAASTYAVGRIFVEHFESGGSFLTFNPAAAREAYEQHLEEAKSSSAAT